MVRVRIRSTRFIGPVGISILASILSGLLWGICSHEHYVNGFSLVFAFVPAWYVWFSEKSLIRVFLYAWITQFVFSIYAFFWVKHTLFTFWGFEGLPMWSGLITFSVVAHLYIPLIAWLMVFLKRRYVLSLVESLVFLVLIHTLAELAAPKIFPFSLGHVWYFLDLPIQNLADITGFAMLSGINYTIQAIILYGLICLEQGSKWSCLVTGFVGLVLVFLLSALGALKDLKEFEPDLEMRTHIYQSNIEPYDMLLRFMDKQSAVDRTFDRYQSGQKFLFQQSWGIDVIVWPETAMPFEILRDNPNLEKLSKFVRELNTPLIAGALSFQTGKKQNVVGYFDKTGELVDHYKKHILMPFGEYIPGRSWLPFFKRLSEKHSPDMVSGERHTIFELGPARISPSVCYESLFTGHISESIRAGRPNLLLNASSDWWFGDTKEPFQHYKLASALSVEYRLPLIRATDSGITTVVDFTGRSLRRSPLYKEWYTTVDVPFRKNPTPTVFAQFGGYYKFSVAIVFGLLVLIRLAVRRSVSPA